MSIRFLSILTFSILLCGYSAFAQTESISDLESQINSATGKDKAVLLIRLSDAQLASGDAKAAEKSASDAEKLARKAAAPYLRAMAMGREARAIEARGKLQKAWKKFEQSNTLARSVFPNGRSIVLENLEDMKPLAVRLGNEAKLASMEQRLLQKNGKGEVAVSSDMPLTRNELREELRRFGQASVSRSEKEEEFLKERKELRETLEMQRATIDSMSEEQMRVHLIALQQKSLVDSLIYQSDLDSLSLAQASSELQASEANTRFYLAALIAALLLAGGATFSFVQTRRHARELKIKNSIIRDEQSRSEKLLLNILPALVAEELKEKGRTDARYFEDVSVLFADFVGFTKIAEKLSPKQLVGELDQCFQAFDEIIARFKLEKIKTIGDAYMCAGGLPNGGGAQLKDMVAAALEMQRWLANYNIERTKTNLPPYEARIGIHRGPVVAGVVGSRKFAFDIWGDTVNIAARVEQAGEGGKINISGEVYEIIKKYYPCTYRGKIAAKNKGEIDMYFVE